MGVRGLQSFLKNNQHLLGERVLLTNAHLVIDGNNLLCYLFSNFTQDRRSLFYRNDIYSGDLVAYGDAVREFFNNLKKCNITAILVFDGSVIGNEELKEFIPSKEAEIYRRGLQKFQSSKTLTEKSALEGSDDDSIILPQQLHVVFRIIIEELGIKKIQVPYEADSHIARVANDLDCFVLTNDSDFIIYHLNKGFVLLDFFDYKKIVIEQQKNCIGCLTYSQARLTRKVPGLQKENMPLLSVLLGNDYVEAGTFDRVIESICNQFYNGHLEAKSYNHRRIANLLLWLRNRSLNEAIDYILNLVHHTRRPKLERCIRMFLRNYQIEETVDIYTELNRIYPDSKLAPNARSEESPAKYLSHLIEFDVIPGTTLDIIFKNTYYNYSILDDHNSPTATIPMLRPFSLALVLLRPIPYSSLTTCQRKLQSEKDSYHICDRVRSEYTKLIIRPMENLENFGSLEHLDCYSMIVLEPALKKNILMATFRFNIDEMNLISETLSLVIKQPAISEATICFLLIKYISLETRVKPKSQFVNAIILTYFYYAALNGDLNLTAIADESYGKFLLRLRPHSMSNSGQTYADDPTLYRKIIHMLSQLHAAYKGYNLINSLLGHVFTSPRYDKWFNGTLIFRITKLLRLGNETMDGLCSNLQILLDVCDSIRLQLNSE